MTHPKFIEKGREYTLFGEELDYVEVTITKEGNVYRHYVYKKASFCNKKVRYDGRFDLGLDKTRCNVCHRRIRRGYEFTNAKDSEEKLHFGRCCLINHVNIPDEELIREAEE